MKTTTLLATLITLQTGLASAATCSDLKKTAAFDDRNATKLMSEFNIGSQSHMFPICRALNIDGVCTQLYSAITQISDDDAFTNAFLPLFKTAIEDMDQQTRLVFRDLVVTLRDSYTTANRLAADASKTRNTMKAQKCDSILGLMKMTDAVLVSESANSKIGHCKVIPTKVSGRTEFVLSVAGEDYPIKGVTYASIPEVAKSLREALDSGSCF